MLFFNILHKMLCVDHVLYINLSHRRDRLENIVSECKRTGIPSEKMTRVEAIYTPRVGMLGCSLSHCKALELALSHPEWTWTLILEDDTKFKENLWTEVEAALKNVNPDVLMITRGYAQVHQPPHRSSSNLYKVYTACVSSGYIIHKNYIPKLLKNIRESIEGFIKPGGNIYDYPLDVYWYSIQKTDNWYAFMVSPASSGSFTSDIQNDDSNKKRLINIHIEDEDEKLIDIDVMERSEQDLVQNYINENDIVLELGARYGSVSCIINTKLKCKTNQVSVEPDERVWKALEKNKKKNKCEFHIVNGFISTKKLGLINSDTYCKGYGTTCILQDDSQIPSYTMKEIYEKYNLRFNVLVADCEGFLEIFFDENPSLYDTLRLIIFEADYTEKCNYDKIRNTLDEKGFIEKLGGHQNVWIRL